MKKILGLLAFCCLLTFGVGAQIATPDTLRGVAIVLAEGGRVTIDPNTGYAHISRGLVLMPEWAICIQTPIEAPSAQTVNEISIGWNNRFFRVSDGDEIPSSRIFWFKKMDIDGN